MKIGDFGVACKISGENKSGFCKTIVGTHGYMAPEMEAGIPYQTISADLFSLGVILFCLYTGHMPFSKADVNDNTFK